MTKTIIERNTLKAILEKLKPAVEKNAGVQGSSLAVFHSNRIYTGVGTSTLISTKLNLEANHVGVDFQKLFDIVSRHFSEKLELKLTESNLIIKANDGSGSQRLALTDVKNTIFDDHSQLDLNTFANCPEDFRESLTVSLRVALEKKTGNECPDSVFIWDNALFTMHGDTAQIGWFYGKSCFPYSIETYEVEDDNGYETQMELNAPTVALNALELKKLINFEVITDYCVNDDINTVDFVTADEFTITMIMDGIDTETQEDVAVSFHDMPTEDLNKVILRKETVTPILQLLKNSISKDTGYSVEVGLTNNQIHFKADNHTCSGEYKVDCNYNGEEMTFKMNLNHLLTMLSVGTQLGIQDGCVSITANSGNSGIIVGARMYC